MTGGELFLGCLRAHGVRAVFGMPGTQNLHVYDAFHRHGQGACHFLIRNEQAATLLANGFARASGEVGVALTVPGPGATNASTGIVDAYTDCVPVLLITGGYDRPTAGRDRAKMFHGLDQRAFFAPITRYFGCPQTIEEIPKVVADAFRAMLSGRPGPAVIEMPPDLAAADAGEAGVPGSKRSAGPDDSFTGPSPRSDPATGPLPADSLSPRERVGVRGSTSDRQPDAAQVAEAAALIVAFQRPAILVGADVIASGAVDELRELAEHLEAPVIETRLAKGSLSAEHRLWAGHCREPHVRNLLQESDGLVAVGTRFTQIDTSHWTAEYPRALVQLDRDEREIGRELPAEVGVVGDLKPALAARAAELKSRGPAATTDGWKERLAELRDEAAGRPPVPVLSQIRAALPRDGIFVGDVTSLAYRSFGEFPVYAPRQFLYPCHSVTLGFAFPAALGAKVACPDRPVVALCGDGGFVMTCYELATAVEHQIGVVAVVVADRSLTAIRASQEKQLAGRTIDTDMHVPDFAALARAFGAEGQRAAGPDELVPLIEAALSRRGPTVIEVPMAERYDEIVAQIPWLESR